MADDYVNFTRLQQYDTKIKTVIANKDTIKEQRSNATIKFWVGTEAQYNAITTKDSNTIYHILE